MPIEISWFDSEKTILFGRFTGIWTWEDYSKSFITTIELTKGLEYRLDQIIDMSVSGPIPLGQALTQINRSSTLSKPLKIRLTVFVGASPILHGLMSALSITNPERSPRLFADSIEEAYGMIQSDRKKNISATD